MIIEIQGEKTGGLLMFGDIAVKLLKMMGQSGQTEGAIRAEDVPSALSSLRSALDQLPAEANPEASPDDGENETQAVGLHTRAKPLLDLLTQSAEDGGYVMWKPQ